MRGRTLAAVLGLALLAGVAFLVGALAGLVWKEPDLLVAYLRGETTEVEWNTAATDVPAPAAEPPAAEADPDDTRVPLPVVEPPRIASAKPQAPKAAAPKPEPPEAAAPKPQPQRTAASPPPRATSPAPSDVAAPPPVSGRSSVAIQVGAFGERAVADRLRASLKQDGYPAYVAAGVGGESASWRVRVGPYATRDEADRVARVLKRTHELPTWVVDEDTE